MEIFFNAWVIGIGTAVIAGIILRLLFGDGRKRAMKIKREQDVVIKDSPIRGNVVVGDNNVVGSLIKDYPEINLGVIGPFRNGAAGLEIFNTGTEDVRNVEVIARYESYNEFLKVPETREHAISSFINENDDPVMIHPASSLNFLRKGEKKIALGVPNITVNKKIVINIRCIGLRSGKLFDKKQTLKTLRAYPNVD